jgi:rod shape-determining protein MreC
MQKRQNFLKWIFIFLVFLLLLNFFIPVSSTIKNSFFSLTTPLQKIFTRSGNSFFKNFEVFQNSKKIKEEIELLRKENAKMLSSLTTFEEIKRENDAFREALKITNSDKKNLVFCEVIGKDFVEQQLIVRQTGEIEIGNFVITPEGVLVGVVSDIQERFAKVEMITSKKSSLEVRIQNEEEPIGILKGTGNNTLFLDFLPKEKEVKIGDRISTISKDEEGTNGIFIGRVLEIKNNDVEAFNQADVWQGIDYHYLDYLFIINE